MTFQRWLLRARGLGAAGLLYLAGCPTQDLAPLEPCTVSGVSLSVPQDGVDKVDLLFVIDNSRSMAQEQVNLRRQLPRLVQVLTSGDREAGVASPQLAPERRFFSPVTSLHLGVVSTDLGGSSQPRSNCTSPDHGVMQSSVELATTGFSVTDDDREFSVAPDPRCAQAQVDRFLRFEAPSAEMDREQAAEQVAHTFGCVATLGVGGCGFEQPLEAMLRALSPSARVDFADGQGMPASGQGAPAGANAGFLRDDAVLAVVIVSDEEDCSVTPEGLALFAGGGPFAAEPVNLRCGLHRNEETLVRGVDRYVAGLRALKPDHPDRIVFAAIVGVAPNLEGQDFATMLEHTTFKFDEEEARTNPNVFPTPACTSPQGFAAPGERFIRVAQQLGEAGVIRSICTDDFGPALDGIIEKIAARLTGGCLPRPLPLDSQGLVACRVLEVLPEGSSETSCDAARGRTFKEWRALEDGSRRVVCDVPQVRVVDGVIAADARGWYYDDFSAELEQACPEGQRQKVAFAPGAELLANAEALVECYQPVTRSDPDAAGRAAVNTPCDPAGASCRSAPDEPLVCVGKTCQLSCPNGTSAECPLGWECVAQDTDTPYCTLPTCPPSLYR